MNSNSSRYQHNKNFQPEPRNKKNRRENRREPGKTQRGDFYPQGNPHAGFVILKIMAEIQVVHDPSVELPG